MHASMMLMTATLAVLAIFSPSFPIARAATNSTDLKILVPLKLGFQEFVSWIPSETPVTSNSVVNFSGFAIEVFRKCVEKLGYSINYTLVPFGDGVSDPTYNDLVQKLVSKEADGIVADLTITAERSRLVDFTQPYISSTLQMVVPLQSMRDIRFTIVLTPFSWELWAIILALYFFTIFSIFIMEYYGRAHDDNGHWTNTLSKSFWLTSMALFFSHREDAKTHLGRALTLFWLATVLIFTSSYIASLSSTIIAHQRRQRPTIQSFGDLYNNSHHKIGYQDGSFLLNYLKNNLLISSERLVPLSSQTDYDNALTLGNVSAIIDESPYLATFLTNLGCKYTIADSNIGYFGGLGFAFQKNSSLTNDMSLSILSLQQNGDLQRIKDIWLGSGVCIMISPNTGNMSLNSFGGLFIAILISYVMCVLLRFLCFRRNRAIAHSYIEMERTRNQNPHAMDD